MTWIGKQEIHREFFFRILLESGVKLCVLFKGS
jgi:hypothetical protein